VTRPAWRNSGPLWIRVYVYALAHHDQGHARLSAGELQRELGPTTPGSISRAIATAVTGGWLAPISSARCLVIPGAERHACPAIHPGDT
jgi:hypothetical protein